MRVCALSSRAREAVEQLVCKNAGHVNRFGIWLTALFGIRITTYKFNLLFNGQGKHSNFIALGDCCFSTKAALWRNHNMAKRNNTDFSIANVKHSMLAISDIQKVFMFKHRKRLVLEGCVPPSGGTFKELCERNLVGFVSQDSCSTWRGGAMGLGRAINFYY